MVKGEPHGTESMTPGIEPRIWTNASRILICANILDVFCWLASMVLLHNRMTSVPRNTGKLKLETATNASGSDAPCAHG